MVPLQSFIRTNPKIWSSARSTVMGEPRLLQAPPTKNAISNSKSISLHFPKTGGVPAKAYKIFRKKETFGTFDWLSLAVGATNRGTRNYNGAGPAVVAHREVLPAREVVQNATRKSKVVPIWHQRVFFASEHDAHVGGVVDGGVEVGVVSDLRREVHGGVVLRHKSSTTIFVCLSKDLSTLF
jgi:hypothetical protein